MSYYSYGDCFYEPACDGDKGALEERERKKLDIIERDSKEIIFWCIDKTILLFFTPSHWHLHVGHIRHRVIWSLRKSKEMKK